MRTFRTAVAMPDCEGATRDALLPSDLQEGGIELAAPFPDSEVQAQKDGSSACESQEQHRQSQQTQPRSQSRTVAKVVVFVAIVAAAIAANAVFGWTDWVMSGRLHDELTQLVNQNYALACALYCVVAIVGCVVLALPGVLFALAAGAVFGPVVGTVLCWASMTLGACGAFCVGRYFLKDALKPRLEKSQLLNRLLFEGADRSDVFVLAVTRLVPVFPFNLQNFAYGITDIRFAPYALYSALFILPGTAAYTLAAAGILDAQNRVVCIVVAVVLFVASFALALALKRKAGV